MLLKPKTSFDFHQVQLEDKSLMFLDGSACRYNLQVTAEMPNSFV